MRLPCRPPACFTPLALSLATHSCHGGVWALLSARLVALTNAKPTHSSPPVMCLITCRWHNRKDWNTLIRNGMTSDLSWDRAAKDYEQIFKWALMDPAQA